MPPTASVYVMREATMKEKVYKTAKVFLGITAAVLSWAYTELVLRSWFSFSFSFLSASAELRDLVGLVAFAVIFSRAVMYGIVAALIAKMAKTFQLLVAGIIAFVLLLPYGSPEGTFLPIIPAFIAGACMLAAYLGQRIALKVLRPRHG